VCEPEADRSAHHDGGKGYCAQSVFEAVSSDACWHDTKRASARRSSTRGTACCAQPAIRQVPRGERSKSERLHAVSMMQ